MIPKNLCSQCGAHIDIQTLKCPFCNTSFQDIDTSFSKKLKEEKIDKNLLLEQPENITDKMMIEKIKCCKQGYVGLSSSPFFILSTLFIAIAIVLMIFLKIVLIPIIIIIGGLGFLILAIFCENCKNEREVINFINCKNYEGATNVALKYSNKISCKIIFLLLKYYRMSEYAEVKNILFSFNLNKLSKAQYDIVENISSNYISTIF